jgi:hypothetical protein
LAIFFFWENLIEKLILASDAATLKGFKELAILFEQGFKGNCYFLLKRIRVAIHKPFYFFATYNWLS